LTPVPGDVRTAIASTTRIVPRPACDHDAVRNVDVRPTEVPGALQPAACSRVRYPMSSLRIIPLASRSEWTDLLNGPHDFYHLPFYHELAQDLKQGEPGLFVYENGTYRICLPLLIRRIDTQVDSSGEEQWFDATSVYGYAGPVASHSHIPEPIKRDFRETLSGTLREMRVVSLFSRLHPLLRQLELVEGLGALVSPGHTIAIDLTVPEEHLISRYRENHRRGLEKLRESGATCGIDEDLCYLDAFIAIYDDTMHRVGATESYRFPRSYFDKLVSTREAEVKLVVCEIGGHIAGAGIFVKCGDILQYHLGGTSISALKVSPMKLVLDTARHWGYEHGAKILHLGGGVGTQDDSLFHFKAGFAGRLHAFNTWRWILNGPLYDELLRSRRSQLSDRMQAEQSTDFFPAYRSQE
jgi:hypothetical protein